MYRVKNAPGASAPGNSVSAEMDTHRVASDSRRFENAELRIIPLYMTAPHEQPAGERCRCGACPDGKSGSDVIERMFYLYI